MSAAKATPPVCADCCAQAPIDPALAADCADAFAKSGGNSRPIAGSPPTLADRPHVAVIVDGCGLEPPEPFVRTMEGLAELPPGGRLLLLLPRQPFPLYRVLENEAYRWSATATARGVWEILIWREEKTEDAGAASGD